MSRRRIVLIVVAAVVAALAVAAVSVVALVGLGSSTPAVPRGDALINLDGVAAAGDGSKSVNVSLGSDPAQHFSGTTGCVSHRFVAYYGGDPHAPLLVTYSASQATMAYAAEIYRFDEGPTQAGGLLMWRGDFGPTGTFSQISLEIACAAP